MTGKKRAVDVEFVYSSLSNQNAYGDVQSLPRLILTPRSSESLLVCGVDPEELRIRDLDSFWEPKIDPKIQRLRHEDYSVNRRDMMKEVRECRNRLMKKKGGKKRPKPKVSEALGLAKNEDEDDIAELVEQEQARLRKIQIRKQKEVEQMLAFEMRQVELQEEAKNRLEGENKRRERIKKEKERRIKEEKELQKMREIRRTAELAFEEKQRKKLARAQFEKEREIAHMMKEKEKQLKREAMQKQIERDQRAEALREQTQAILKRQETELLQRMKKAEEKEKARQQKIREQKAIRKSVAEEKMRRQKKRIELNRIALQEAERKRSETILIKEKNIVDRQNRLKEEREEEMRLLRQQQLLTEEKRLLCVEEAKREEEMRAIDLMERQAQATKALVESKQHKERLHEIRREQARLKSEAKRRNVDRTKRKEEYKRLTILKKLTDDRNRISNIEKKKQEIIVKRKQATINAKIQRDTINVEMEKIRTHKKWKEADKLLDKIVTRPSKGSKSKRKKKAKRNNRQSYSMPTLLTAAEQQKASAAIADRAARGVGAAAAGKGISAAAAAAIELRRQSAFPGSQSQSQAYISPYEMASVPKTKSGVSTLVPAFATEVDGSVIL